MKALAIFFIKFLMAIKNMDAIASIEGMRGPIGTGREGRTEPDGGVHA